MLCLMYIYTMLASIDLNDDEMCDTPESLLKSDEPCGDAALVGLARSLSKSIRIFTDIEVTTKDGTKKGSDTYIKQLVLLQSHLQPRTIALTSTRGLL
jgi:hypothetical protein